MSNPRFDLPSDMNAKNFASYQLYVSKNKNSGEEVIRATKKGSFTWLKNAVRYTDRCSMDTLRSKVKDALTQINHDQVSPDKTLKGHLSAIAQIFSKDRSSRTWGNQDSLKISTTASNLLLAPNPTSTSVQKTPIQLDQEQKIKDTKIAYDAYIGNACKEEKAVNYRQTLYNQLSAQFKGEWTSDFKYNPNYNNYSFSLKLSPQIKDPKEYAQATLLKACNNKKDVADQFEVGIQRDALGNHHVTCSLSPKKMLALSAHPLSKPLTTEEIKTVTTFIEEQLGGNAKATVVDNNTLSITKQVTAESHVEGSNQLLDKIHTFCPNGKAFGDRKFVDPGKVDVTFVLHNASVDLRFILEQAAKK